jgi:acyl CoA:acetate/3-ketoacid CoA transferase alpha subunit
VQSAWLVLDHGIPTSWDKQPNAELAARLRAGAGGLPLLPSRRLRLL